MEHEVEMRAKKYLENVEGALAEIGEVGDPRVKHVVELARSYKLDAEYYLEKGDAVTSLACASYAEGLLDSLGMLGLARVRWPQAKRPRVLVGGVFEILHPGHLYLLKRAKEMGRVVVVVARDSTVLRFKGRKPVVPEVQRLEVVRSLKYVDEAYLGNDPLDVEGTLMRLKPDIVLLGPDQGRLEKLVRDAASKLEIGVRIVKLEERVNLGVSSSSDIIRRILALTA